MALLEEATMAEMVDFIGQSLGEAEKANEPEEPEPQAETEEDMEASVASEDVNEEEASPSHTEEDVKEDSGEEQDVVEVQVDDSEPEEPQQQKDSKWVPRDRINEVNDKWRQREQQLMMQMGALNERVNQLSTPRPAPRVEAEPDWLGSLIDEDGSTQQRSDPRIDQLQQKQQQIVQWQEQQVRTQVYNDFHQELATAMEKYPAIPEQAFRDAVARDGSVNMLELGGSISSEREKLVSQWKSDWEKTQPKTEAAAPEAVRRPARRSTATSAPAKAKENNYSTVREAGDAMANELADFFESLNQ